MNKDVFLLRAAADKEEPVNAAKVKEAKQSDTKRAFVESAALHMINYASIRDLKSNMEQKYSTVP